MTGASRRANRGEIAQSSAELGYQHTLMYGRYTDLGDYAREEAARIRAIEKIKWREKELTAGFKPYRGKCRSTCINVCSVIWRYTFAKIGEEWVFLAILGVSMAFLSFAMDYGISMCQRARLWLYRDLSSHIALQYIAWTSFPLVLILFSSGFTHIVAPQAIGSGIPELKTILRGVVLKEYLTVRTLISKVVGLTTCLGSGVPLGKEGPFVHISSNVAALLSKVFTSLGAVVYENESRNHEMLAAACAVGVACCFASPVGGVLFSIEATTAYFAVRNYWRGFFGAVAGAMMFRLMAVWFTEEETLTSLFRTNFRLEVPFDPQELLAFALMGVFCGLGGSTFVYLHRQYVLWMRRNKRINRFLQKNRFLYPSIITMIISSVTFPPGLGQFVAAELGNHDQLVQLFSNFTWVNGVHDPDQADIIKKWTPSNSNLFQNLLLYIFTLYWTAILASTMPVAAGVFIPHFKMGAAFGRIVGELMAYIFPEGVHFGSNVFPVLPGGYAVAGAAAWSGAATHTISTSLIAFELTGQINHFLPVMISVLIANAVAQALQPSVYDSIIRIKRLPYLPDLLSTSSKVYNIFIEDIMVRDVKYIWVGMSHRDIKQLLEGCKKIKTFPLVDSHDARILIGSVQRTELIAVLARHMGRERRLHMAARHAMQAQEQAAESSTGQLSPNQLTIPGMTGPGGAPLSAPATISAGDAGASASTDIIVSEPSQSKDRRPSRFEVTPAPDMLHSKGEASGQEADKRSRPIVSGRPKKSILKKSYSMGHYYSPATSPSATPYSTVTSVNYQDTRLRQAFEAIFRKTQALRSQAEPYSPNSTITGSMKKVTLPKERVIDMSPEEQKDWEEEQLDLMVNFNRCHIDPAPFQLVERTSLMKAHTLFSMLGLNHAYVTAIGRLVGVVALKEIRTAIEGNLPSKETVRMKGHGGLPSDVLEAGLGSINYPSVFNDPHYMNTVSSFNSESGIMTTDSEAEDPPNSHHGNRGVSKL